MILLYYEKAQAHNRNFNRKWTKIGDFESTALNDYDYLFQTYEWDLFNRRDDLQPYRSIKQKAIKIGDSIQAERYD